MKILKREAFILCVVFLALGIMSLILGAIWLSLNLYRTSGFHYFIVFCIVIVFTLAGVFNLLYYLYLRKEEQEGYYFTEQIEKDIKMD